MYLLISSLLLLLSELPQRASSIVCYKCDATETPNGDCPGWHRQPVDTFHDLHDKGGLYTHCVEIKLGNGTIILQGAYPENPTCARDFRLIWRQTLEKRFQQRVWVRCCDYNLCNGSPRRLLSSLSRFGWSGLTFVICVLHFVVFGGFLFGEANVRWRKTAAGGHV